MADIPDSISFSTLRELSKQKQGSRLDFSDPKISQDIGDLAFLYHVFMMEKLEGTFSHQRIFLADTIITELRGLYEDRLRDACKQEKPDPNTIEILSKFVAHFRICEGILDGIVSMLMRKMDTTSTLPSYRLVKSLDPSVRPHEIEEWVKGFRP